MGAGQNVYTYVSFSSQNISNFMGSKTLTIEFLNNKYFNGHLSGTNLK